MLLIIAKYMYYCSSIYNSFESCTQVVLYITVYSVPNQIDFWRYLIKWQLNELA